VRGTANGCFLAAAHGGGSGGARRWQRRAGAAVAAGGGSNGAATAERGGSSAWGRQRGGGGARRARAVVVAAAARGAGENLGGVVKQRKRLLAEHLEQLYFGRPRLSRRKYYLCFVGPDQAVGSMANYNRTVLPATKVRSGSLPPATPLSLPDTPPSLRSLLFLLSRWLHKSHVSSIRT
jgi:hypothetical protein